MRNGAIFDTPNQWRVQHPWKGELVNAPQRYEQRQVSNLMFLRRVTSPGNRYWNHCKSVSRVVLRRRFGAILVFPQTGAAKCQWYQQQDEGKEIENEKQQEEEKEKEKQQQEEKQQDEKEAQEEEEEEESLLDEEDEMLLDEIATWCLSADGLVEHLQPSVEELKDNDKTYVSSLTIYLKRQEVNIEEIDKAAFVDDSTAHESDKNQWSVLPTAFFNRNIQTILYR